MRKFILLLLFFPSLIFAQTNLMQRFFDNLEKKTLISDFTITVTEKATQPTTITGNITMQETKFKAQFMGMEIAYDGTTLYSYSEDNNELTLSTPMQEELADINPLLFAKAITESCKTEIKEQNDNYAITLIPQESGSGIRDFVINIRKHDLMPLSATMRETGMKTTAIIFRNSRFSPTWAEFIINKPNAYRNDLR